jgi:aromatic ring-opening dioxygenase catalytic subunit (LigB family)
MIPYESGYTGVDETLYTTFFLMYPDSHIELVTLAMTENPNQ